MLGSCQHFMKLIWISLVFCKSFVMKLNSKHQNALYIVFLRRRGFRCATVFNRDKVMELKSCGEKGALKHSCRKFPWNFAIRIGWISSVFLFFLVDCVEISSNPGAFSETGPRYTFLWVQGSVKTQRWRVNFQHSMVVLGLGWVNLFRTWKTCKACPWKKLANFGSAGRWKTSHMDPSSAIQCPLKASTNEVNKNDPSQESWFLWSARRSFWAAGPCVWALGWLMMPWLPGSVARRGALFQVFRPHFPV